jgi:hypothetical protein
MYAINGILHLLVVAHANNLDLLAQIAAADQRENSAAFADGEEDGIQNPVNALNYFAIVSCELICSSALSEAAFVRSLNQPGDFLLKPIIILPGVRSMNLWTGQNGGAF